VGSAALVCLAMNIYFEARGESLKGQKLVAEVTLNRVRSKKWPSTLCEVVHEPYQFSWTINPYQVQDWKAFSTALIVAESAMNNNLNTCVDHYHNFTVEPTWGKNMRVYRVEGNHIFYCSEN